MNQDRRGGYLGSYWLILVLLSVVARAQALDPSLAKLDSSGETAW